MNRRRFLSLAATAGALSACGDDGPSLDAPTAVGTPDDVDTRIAEGGGALYLSDAKAYIVSVTAADRDRLLAAYSEAPTEAFAAIDAGYIAISERCPHQSCRVPYCESSGGFECRCHGSRFTPYGEVTRGPSDRGMDLYGLQIADGQLTIDTAVRLRRTDDVAVEIEPSGPHCV